MTATITGNGIDKVQDGTIQSADLAAGVPARSNLPAGTVLQVVSGITTSAGASSSSTYSDTSLTATITPTNATSKILVFVSQNGINKSVANASNRIGLRLVRDATVLSTFGVDLQFTGTTIQNTGSASCSYLDSPGTTAATTYKTQFSSVNNTASVNVQASGDASSITLMEIAA